MENKYITVGYIIATHGLRGGLKIKPATSFIDERFKVGKKLIVLNPLTNEEETLTLKTINEQKGILTVTVKEIDDINIAENYLQRPILINKETNKLKKGYFYFDDLIKMSVTLEDGTLVGKVSEVLEYASYYSLRVKREDKSDLIIPYVEAFIIDTDADSNTIIFRPIEGML